MPWDPFLMKKLLKSEIYGSINSTLMHCLLQKSQHLRLLFNEQYMNSNRVSPKRVKKKKKKRTKMQNADMSSKRRCGSKHTLTSNKQCRINCSIDFNTIGYTILQFWDYNHIKTVFWTSVGFFWEGRRTHVI